MDSKTCTKCSITKPVGDFNKKRSGYSSYCRSCMNEYSRAHYRNNKASYKRRTTASREKARTELKRLKESNPCSDCGKHYPHYVMEFDHLNPLEKKGCVSELANSGIKMMLAEIEKCELVCANCHRERTHGGG